MVGGALDAQSAGGEEQAPVDAYIASGQEAGRVWHPSFCWHGFRYAQISGPAGWRGGRLWAEEVCAGVRQTGRFECSEPTLNGLFQLYLQSQRTNLHGGVPSDCPHRERLGYTGDGQLTAPAALCCLEMMPLYRKWLRDILDAQCRRTGHVPHTAPFEGGGGGPGGWGCAVALLPWAMYRYQGEVQLLRDCMPAMEAWVGYLERHLDGDGLVACEEEGGWCLGDWCPPGAVELPEPLVNSFFYVKCLEILGASCALLGEAEVAGRWRERAKRVARAMHQRYLKGKDYACATQGANAFALELGYLTEEQQAALLQGLLERLEALGGHLDTGIFGTPVLLYALSRRGHIREALKMLTVPGFPGYAHMMERGATTLWENWSGEASHNHPMFGAAVAWLFEELAGIGQSEGAGGLEELVIAPKGLGLLSHLEAVRPTPLGPVELSWRWEGEEARMRLSLPVGSRAELLLAGVALEAVEPPVPEAQEGGGRLALGSGEYRLHLRRS